MPSSRNLRSQKKGKENFTAVINQRRKAAPSHISYTLKESEIQEDLAAIQKVRLLANTLIASLIDSRSQPLLLHSPPRSAIARRPTILAATAVLFATTTSCLRRGCC